MHTQGTWGASYLPYQGMYGIIHHKATCEGLWYVLGGDNAV